MVHLTLTFTPDCCAKKRVGTEKAVPNFNGQRAQLARSKNFGEAYVLFSQALYRLENLRQVVNSYYPQFHEIKELKSLYLEVLGAQASIFRYIIDSSQNPYLYSESQFNYLSNAWDQAYNTYNAKYRVLCEQFP